MHHWTEQKTRVHACYSVIALKVAHLMRRHAHHHGLGMSVRRLLTELADITTSQQHLYDLFDLDRYAPHR